ARTSGASLMGAFVLFHELYHTDRVASQRRDQGRKVKRRRRPAPPSPPRRAMRRTPATPSSDLEGRSEHTRDGITDIVDIFIVHGCHADAPGADDIEAVFFAQSLDLFGRQSGIGEHPALILDEAEILLGALLDQGRDELFAHLADALAHLGQL